MVLCTGLPVGATFYPAASVLSAGNTVQILSADQGAGREPPPPQPAGQPWTNTIQIQGAGGARGSKCNGTYTEFGQHNGKPLYVQQGGQARIYFNNYWKISETGSTSGWCYGVDTLEGRGSHPPTAWRSDGYSGSDTSPLPTLKFVSHVVDKGKEGADLKDSSDTVTSKEAEPERIVGRMATCRRALSEKEPVVELQIIAPRVTSPPVTSPPVTSKQHTLGVLSAESAPIVMGSELSTQKATIDWISQEVTFETNFPTIRSRQMCPAKKAAHYEIEILSPLINPQFGFCCPGFSPTDKKNGTGDCKYSWAVDGCRGLLWHNGKRTWFAK